MSFQKKRFYTLSYHQHCKYSDFRNQISRRQSTGPALNTVFTVQCLRTLICSQNAGKKVMEELREDPRRKKSGMLVVHFTPLSLCNFSYNYKPPYH